MACFTYENASVVDDVWSGKATVWVLGRRFALPEEKETFIEHVRSRIWLTYRRGFDPIGGTGPTSDSGWGCMLRCGQMMLAQALMKMKLDPKWKWRPNELQTKEYYKILKRFSDERSSPFSIQQIAQMGVQEGKKVGDWFGPNTVAQVLKRLAAFDKWSNIAIHVAMDSTVAKKDVRLACDTETKDSTTKVSIGSEGSVWRPLLLIIPLRLGLTEVNSMYYKNLRSCFTWEQSVGIIGGKPNHAYYFIGCVDSDSMVFLDPHTTQANVPWNGETLDMLPDMSYHCDSPSKMCVSQLDPSLAIGFFCKDKRSFDDFCEKALDQTCANKANALFTIVESLPTCDVVESRVLSVSVHNRNLLRMGMSDVDDNSCLTLDSDEDLNDIDEEFEILDVK